MYNFCNCITVEQFWKSRPVLNIFCWREWRCVFVLQTLQKSFIKSALLESVVSCIYWQWVDSCIKRLRNVSPRVQSVSLYSSMVWVLSCLEWLTGTSEHSHVDEGLGTVHKQPLCDQRRLQYLHLAKADNAFCFSNFFLPYLCCSHDIDVLTNDDMSGQL